MMVAEERTGFWEYRHSRISPGRGPGLHFIEYFEQFYFSFSSW